MLLLGIEAPIPTLAIRDHIDNSLGINSNNVIAARFQHLAIMHHGPNTVEIAAPISTLAVIHSLVGELFWHTLALHPLEETLP